jgi:hypothetical protein
MEEMMPQERKTPAKNENAPVPNRLVLFILFGLILGWGVDFLFWKRQPGISIAVWLLLPLILLLILTKSEKIRIHKASFGLMGLILLAIYFYTIRQEPLSTFANTMAALFGLVLLAATYKNGNWLYYRLFDYVIPMLNTVFGGLLRPFTAIAQRLQQTKVENERPIGKAIFAVIRGLIITIPILLVLGSLLASADTVFKGVLGDLLDWFVIDDLGEYIFRFGYVLFFSLIFTGVFFQALYPQWQAKRPDPSKPVVKPFLGWIETIMIFSGINAMFLLFVVIQFNYLFGGERNIHQSGFNYSTYARQGFGELVAVAILSLLIYLVLAGVSKRESEARRHTFSGLSVLLIVQVLVMLVSSFKRLGLYEAAYGFTRLRMYTHVFIICLAVLLVVVIALEVLNIRGRFALAFLGFCFLFSFALGAVNVDAQIARLNVLHSATIRHTENGPVLDFEYLDSLSNDATPQLIKMYANPDLPDNTHKKIGAALMCKLYQAEMKPEPNWRSYSVANAVAKRQLLAIRDSLYDVYSVEEERGGVTVRSGTDEWVCDSYWELYMD